MVKLYISIISFFIASATLSQNIVFQDANFKQILLTNPQVIDLNNDREISIQEANNFSDSINPPFGYGTVSSLQGLEHFTQLKGFHIENMSITSIDFSNNLQLNYVQLTDNFALAGNIDMSAHTNLTYFNVENTQVNKVNLNNGNNTNITYCDLAGATCVAVDDVRYSSSAPNWFESNTSIYTTTPCFATVGQSQILNNKEVLIYPNPTQEILNITTDYHVDAIEIIDINGKVVLNATNQMKNINIKELINGFYTVLLKKDNITISRKQFIKD